MLRSLALALTVLIAAPACASEGDSPSSASHVSPSPDAMGGMDHGETFAFGEPGDPSAADRIVMVRALDGPRFDPASIEVQAGETVTFDVTNDGLISHEFVLGDAATQDQHEGEMGSGRSMSDEPNAVAVEPSQRGSLTWTFTEPGTFLYACHVDDHYAGGMIGTIMVMER